MTDKTKNNLLAGVAKSDITTDDRADIHDPLYAKALVLADETTRLVILSLDTTAIGGRRVGAGMLDDVSEEFLPQLRNRIENELKIPGSSVLVNASHTHPPGVQLCDDAQQVERTFDAVRRAMENMVPVKIGSGVGYEDRISINRTLRMKDGSHWTMRHAYPCPPDEEVAGLGPIDYDIGIVRVDHLDGRPMAVVYNFACHLLIGVPGGAITANFPAFASREIERNLGDDVMALFLQGAAGDVNELFYKDTTRPRDCESFGTMLGTSALKAIRTIETQAAVPLSVASQTVEFPRRTDIPEQIQSLLKRQDELLASLRYTSLNFKTFLPLYMKYTLDSKYPLDYSYRYMHADQRKSNGLTDLDGVNKANLEKYLNNIHTMEELSKIQDDIETLKKHQSINEESGESTITAEIMGIRIGECVLISAPVEILVQVGLNVKKASPYKHTFIAAYSNGYMHYGPPAEYYDCGGYEVTECFLGPEWQEIYESAAREIIERL